MIDYKDRISSHYQFDDDKYWRFARSSGLPFGYFRRGPTADQIVVAICLVGGIIGLIIGVNT